MITISKFSGYIQYCVFFPTWVLHFKRKLKIRYEYFSIKTQVYLQFGWKYRVCPLYIKWTRSTVISAFGGRFLLMHECSAVCVGGDKNQTLRKIESFLIAVVSVDWWMESCLSLCSVLRHPLFYHWNKFTQAWGRAQGLALASMDEDLGSVPSTLRKQMDW